MRRSQDHILTSHAGSARESGGATDEIAWAKLETLAQSAALATRQLWR